MVFQDGFCNVSLVLSLGNSSQENGKQPWKMANKPSLDRQGLVFPSFHLEPDLSLTLLKSHSKDEEVTNPPKKTDTDMAYGDCAPSCIKRERDSISEDLETERVSSRISTDEDDEGHSKKRLRLTKDQSSFLEDSFKKHSTLNPKQKQALAKQLNLRSRQVEVWFQNRRARTKVKLTEMDREMLKRCCETLRDENRRLHKELQELKALKFTSPLSMQVPAATLTMCPSCERIFTKDKTTKAPPCET